MPQLSFDKASELHTCRVTIHRDEISDLSTVTVYEENKEGAINASASCVMLNDQVAELLPILLAEVGNGWLYGGARECVTLPMGAFRARRKSLMSDR